MKPRRRLRRSRPPSPDREQYRTVFTGILERLIELEPSLVAVALVDAEGEAVDYAGSLSPFETKVTAAYLRIALSQIEPQSESLGAIRQILIRSARRSFLVRPLPDGYALIGVLKRQGFAVSARAIELSERQLTEEAGWPAKTHRGPFWNPVVIETTRDRRRPMRIWAGATWESVDVLGSIVGLGRERGYRCRLRSGAEMTLVREPAGTWYADELIEGSVRDRQNMRA
jgi:hypothetical protein